MGLTLTLRILQIMNAEISVDSTEGQGTTFTVRIPTREKVKEHIYDEW